MKAVDGVSVEVREGQTLGIVGESGSGKTTLGLAILRLIRSEGPILYCGRGIDKLTFKQMRPLRREMQIVFQDPYGSLSPRLSVAEIVEEGLVAQGAQQSAAARRDIVARALSDTGLDPKTMDRYPHEFSGGQRQRIAIARAMALDPKFVVLDEPTSALDMSVQAQIVDLLRELQKRRKLAYLFISHDLKVVRALASEIIVMRQGKVVEAGAAEAVFANPQEDYTRALFAAAFNMKADVIGLGEPMSAPQRRALLIVLDSVGCGAAADADLYGDVGADTLGHIAKACAAGLGDRDGSARRPVAAAASRCARPRARDAGVHGRTAARLCAARA